ncbi:phage tail protein [Microcoleus sp. A003_D6]|uniref:phage tail protein n=1 Tax=Microcoleus sp. A003_D6 TaxID=3055266 RepID=UPI002FD57C54
MSNSSSAKKKSSYIEYLPATVEADPIINGFLLAFESILDKLDAEEPNNPDNHPLGFGEYIERIHTYFFPYDSQGNRDEQAGTEFLPWLASWVALSIREDWDEKFKRQFISNIVPLYNKRGTKAALEHLLKLYTDEEVFIYEFDDPPGYFQVEMTLKVVNPENLIRKRDIAHAIIENEKPAHTAYGLKFLFPTMQIRNDASPTWNPKNPVGIFIGRNTLIGNKTK